MKTNLNELLKIDYSSESGIANSFERIAKELINNYSLHVNDSIFLFTEIEFYLFYSVIHEDKNTHKHKIKSSGRWRGHNQGLDIAFEATDRSDGGILTRGLKQIYPIVEKPNVNGPRRVVFKIFECLNDVLTSNSGINLVKLPKSLNQKIQRTSREGVKVEPYIGSKYRYLTEFENWKDTVPKKYRENIEKDIEPLL